MRRKREEAGRVGGGEEEGGANIRAVHLSRASQAQDGTSDPVKEVLIEPFLVLAYLHVFFPLGLFVRFLASTTVTSNSPLMDRSEKSKMGRRQQEETREKKR